MRPLGPWLIAVGRPQTAKDSMRHAQSRHHTWSRRHRPLAARQGGARRGYRIGYWQQCHRLRCPPRGATTSRSRPTFPTSRAPAGHVDLATTSTITSQDGGARRRPTDLRLRRGLRAGFPASLFSSALESVARGVSALGFEASFPVSMDVLAQHFTSRAERHRDRHQRRQSQPASSRQALQHPRSRLASRVDEHLDLPEEIVQELRRSAIHCAANTTRQSDRAPIRATAVRSQAPNSGPEPDRGALTVSPDGQELPLHVLDQAAAGPKRRALIAHHATGRRTGCTLAGCSPLRWKAPRDRLMIHTDETKRPGSSGQGHSRRRRIDAGDRRRPTASWKHGHSS